jgi:Protein of unknown function (DUF1553)/Protein of unknown function (DUF1549)
MKFLLSLIVPALLSAGVHPVFERADAPAPTPLDRLLTAHWQKLGIQPANPCSDAVFLRRVYLDVTGTLPTAAEAAAFLKNPGRPALIERLLASDRYAAYYAMKWSDLLRVKAEFPINLWPNASQAYYHWIRASVAADKPYDQFARELLTSTGSNFRDPTVNFYRALQSREPQAIAQTVALTFMGTRTVPVTQAHGLQAPASGREAAAAGLAGFFSQIGYKETHEWKEEIIFFDPSKKLDPKPVFPDGTPARLAPNQDPREAFAAWLTAPQNPYFARAIVNRVWSWLLGRGIIHEPDDIRPDNPPENPELLAYLEKQLVANHYDLKSTFREILTSNAYQLSSIPQVGQALSPANRGEAAASSSVPGPRPPAPGPASGVAASFAAYPLRRLDAEVLADAINGIAGSTESYTSAIPEPYTFMPDEQRAVELPDGSITSAFLDLFGKPARDTGFESERNNRITDAQRLHLLNSTSVQRKLQQGPHLAAMMRDVRDPRELINQLYLTILSRYPSDDEWKLIQAHSQTGVRGANAIFDLAWALINSTEFLCRH